MAEVSNEISVAFGALKTKTTGGIYRLDEEQYLVFTDIELPESFRADFGLSETGDTISMVGTENRVLIPDKLLVNAGKQTLSHKSEIPLSLLHLAISRDKTTMKEGDSHGRDRGRRRMGD